VGQSVAKFELPIFTIGGTVTENVETNFLAGELASFRSG
jgi:hypothetical protein